LTLQMPCIYMTPYPSYFGDNPELNPNWSIP